MCVEFELQLAGRVYKLVYVAQFPGPADEIREAAAESVIVTQTVFSGYEGLKSGVLKSLSDLGLIQLKS